MTETRILVPFDFTDAADKAVALATEIALKNGLGVSLLHINDQLIQDVDSKLRYYAEMHESTKKVDFDIIIRQGNIFTEIGKVAEDPCFKLMVIGSHGYKGIREKILGADIFKLIKDLPVPVIVIQKDYSIPENGIECIILPVENAHTSVKIPESITWISKIYSAEIHFFETDTTSTIKYVEELLQYSSNMNRAMLGVESSNSSPPQLQFKKAFELLLTNKYNIPVLCTK